MPDATVEVQSGRSAEPPVRRHRTASLRRHLAGLVLATLLPILVVGGGAAWSLAESYSRAFEAKLQDTARALALFLESELETYLVAVSALATSPLLRRDDLSEFTEWARGVAAATGGWVVVNEAALGHRQLVNTGLPPGAPLPPPSPPGEGAWDLIRRVVESGQPVVSDLFTGRGTGRQLVATAAPVLEGGQVTRVVVLAMDPVILSRRLQELGPTGRAYASVADGNGRIVARSLDPERFLRTVPPSRSVQAEERARGVFRSRSAYGEPSLLVARNLGNAQGWSVVVVEPLAGYRASWLGPLTAIALSGLAAIVTALLVAAGLARRILRPVAALVRRADATAAGRDEVPPGTPARIAEFEVLRVASERAGAALAAREAAYRAIFETAAAGVAEVNAKARRYVRVNRRFCAIVGRTEAELLGGMGPHDLFHPEDRTLVPTYRAVAEGREIEDECRVVRPDGTIRWVRASASVSALDASGRPERAVAVLQDITERRQAEEARALLAQEVDHRSKNALAVVRAAVRLTPRTDAEAYARAIEGRVTALARAHTLLADARWAGAELALLARAELEAFVAPPGEEAGSAPRAEFDGPPVTLASAASQGFAMVLHELATNATKHGALSAPDGRGRLSWRRDEAAGVLTLRWEETGGPPVAHPTRLSFGSRVIDSTIRGQLGGACGTTWAAGGIVFEAEVPLARAVSRNR